jgi:hypothetical protein
MSEKIKGFIAAWIFVFSLVYIPGILFVAITQSAKIIVQNKENVDEQEWGEMVDSGYTMVFATGMVLGLIAGTLSVIKEGD